MDSAMLWSYSRIMRPYGLNVYAILDLKPKW